MDAIFPRRPRQVCARHLDHYRPILLTYMAKRYPKVRRATRWQKLLGSTKQDHSLGPMLGFPSKVYKWLHFESTIPFPCVLCGSSSPRVQGCIRVHCGPVSEAALATHTTSKSAMVSRLRAGELQGRHRSSWKCTSWSSGHDITHPTFPWVNVCEQAGLGLALILEHWYTCERYDKDTKTYWDPAAQAHWCSRHNWPASACRKQQTAQSLGSPRVLLRLKFVVPLVYGAWASIESELMNRVACDANHTRNSYVADWARTLSSSMNTSPRCSVRKSM
jgi:hypothetical protein